MNKIGHNLVDFVGTPAVMYGTGGQTGHAALAVWDDDELYVCESTGKSLIVVGNPKRVSRTHPAFLREYSC